MIIHEVEQGTAEWLFLRLGIPTTSEFGKIITPTGKKSTQADGYANKLAAEFFVEGQVDDFCTAWMERGKELEPKAAGFYEFVNGVKTVPVGFVTNDDKTIGASPDRLVGDDGLLEIKCPSPAVHVGNVCMAEIDKQYWPQVQGQMLITGRQWVDWMSFHPELPVSIIRAERDEGFISALSDYLAEFLDLLEDKKKKLADKGAARHSDLTQEQNILSAG